LTDGSVTALRKYAIATLVCGAYAGVSSFILWYGDDL